MATPLIAGNWKMNTTVAEAVALARELREPLAAVDGVTRVVCPPFVSLAAVAEALDGAPIAVGAQNMHPEPKGAFTGEVSGAMLQPLCTYVILGHSERRHSMGETDELINRKVHAALSLGLTPILCIGETLEERGGGHALEVVERQLKGSLAEVEADAIARLAVAYEPVWAIGTGMAATAETAQEMMGAVRHQISRLSHVSVAAAVPLLYGGSVTAGNVAEFTGEADVDGALVGGASLQAASFVAIAQAIATAKA